MADLLSPIKCRKPLLFEDFFERGWVRVVASRRACSRITGRGRAVRCERVVDNRAVGVTTLPHGVVHHRVTRLERNANIAAVIVPFVGVIVAAVLLWNHFLGPRDLAIFAVLYLASAIGVTVGYHRLLTHRAFETKAWLRYTLAVLGSLSV